MKPSFHLLAARRWTPAWVVVVGVVPLGVIHISTTAQPGRSRGESRRREEHLRGELLRGRLLRLREGLVGRWCRLRNRNSLIHLNRALPLGRHLRPPRPRQQAPIPVAQDQIQPMDPKYRDVVCFNCGDPGHHAGNCIKPKVCFMCGSSGHSMKYCALWIRGIPMAQLVGSANRGLGFFHINVSD